MKISSRYPAGSALGGDFISRHNDLAEGERVVELEIDLEAMPGWGLLCISETTVKGIVRELGLEIVDPAYAAKSRAQRQELNMVRDDNERLKDALARVFDLAVELDLIGTLQRESA